MFANHLVKVDQAYQPSVSTVGCSVSTVGLHSARIAMCANNLVNVDQAYQPSVSTVGLPVPPVSMSDAN